MLPFLTAVKTLLIGFFVGSRCFAGNWEQWNLSVTSESCWRRTDNKRQAESNTLPPMNPWWQMDADPWLVSDSPYKAGMKWKHQPHPGWLPELLQWVTLPRASCRPSTAAWKRINTETQHHRFMKQMYLPLIFAVAINTAPHRHRSQDKHNPDDSPGLFAEQFWQTSSMKGGSQWSLLVTPVTVTLQGLKNMFFSLFLKKALLSLCFYPFLFCLNRGD